MGTLSKIEVTEKFEEKNKNSLAQLGEISMTHKTVGSALFAFRK